MPNCHRLPRSTYRLQLRAGIDFLRAAELVPYLSALGIDFLYLSPPFCARENSSHGYDVVDPNALDPALGGDAGFRQLTERLVQHGMGLLIDIVPNHLAADRRNPLWWDLLEVGMHSDYAGFFDVDWASNGDKLLLPVLGDELGRVLERNELELGRDGGEILVRYFELALPIAAPTWDSVLAPAVGQLDRERARELGEVLSAARSATGSAERIAVKRELARVCQAGAAEAVDAALGACRGDALARLLEAQCYQLRAWRGVEPLNYRRFFTISELVGIRSEEPRVFAATHALILALLADGRVQGLRVDHPDGLADPLGYVELLAEGATRACDGTRPYLVLEKILAEGEELPELPADGTTGYDGLRLLDGVFVEREGGRAVRDQYVRFTGRPRGFAPVVLASKKHLLDQALAPELERLTARAAALLCADYGDCRRLLRELIACFGVYRSYVRPGTSEISGQDRRVLQSALDAARSNVPSLFSLCDRFEALLYAGPGEPGRELLLRLQQLTGPAAAKGIEDTALYRWFPLASLCEVGTSPDRFGIDLQGFHEENARRQAHSPHTMLATTTHDTKRSEDVRARISALSEIPELWAHALEEWSALNRSLKRDCAGEPAPDANDEYLIYQTLLGAWPLERDASDFAQRISAYLVKAVREAKRSSAWVEPNPDYENATVDFARGLLERARSSAFLDSFAELEARLARAGALSSLSRTVLKATCPGIPDFYQGTELWDLSLVDPDNRRPIDFELCARSLAELADARPGALLESWRDGRIKLFITERLLALRNRYPELFARGDYVPLRAVGPAAERVIAFSRQHEGAAILVVVGRYFCRESDGFEKTTLACPPSLRGTELRDVFTSERHSLGSDGALRLPELFRELPVCVLERRS